MTVNVVKRVFDAHGGPKRLWIASGTDHVGAFRHPDYRRVVLGFRVENQS